MSSDEGDQPQESSFSSSFPSSTLSSSTADISDLDKEEDMDSSSSSDDIMDTTNDNCADISWSSSWNKMAGQLERALEDSDDDQSSGDADRNGDDVRFNAKKEPVTATKFKAPMMKTSETAAKLALKSSLKVNNSDDEGIHLSNSDPVSDGDAAATVHSDYHLEGALVWARMKGFSFWPAVVTIDPVECITTKRVERGGVKKYFSQFHIHFLAYPNLHGWVSPSAMMPFQGKSAFDELTTKASSTSKKDFFPTKRYQAKFAKAVQLAEDALKLPIHNRLRSLGYVYIPVSQKPDLRTAAEKKLIPSTNSCPPPGRKSKMPKSEAKASKRPKLYAAAAATNGIRPHTQVKSFQLQSGISSQFSKSEKVNNINNSPAVVSVSASDAESEIRDMHSSHDDFDDDESTTKSDNDEPKLGSLVWGRMPGFPFWPCFITRSPDGMFQRTKNKGRGSSIQYHVQFFNWNDESGWVSKSLPWCSTEELEAMAAAQRKYKAYDCKQWLPQGKQLTQKWHDAFDEADSTASMSRRERHNLYLVAYASVLPVADLNVILKVPVAKRRRRRTPSSTSARGSKGGQAAATLSAASRNDNGPMEQTQTQNVSGQDLLTLIADNLPLGWTHNKAQGMFYSPEGVAFGSVNDVVRDLFTKNAALRPTKRRGRSSSPSPDNGRRFGQIRSAWLLEATDQIYYGTPRERTSYLAGNIDGPVSILCDDSLPSSWMVRQIRQSDGSFEKTFTSPSGAVFKYKFDVANHIFRGNHPSSEIEHIISVTALKTPLKYKSTVLQTVRLKELLRNGACSNAMLEKVVAPSSVEIVRLPDIFLQHPCVSVIESKNEMVICDATTHEFIAKKIIYETENSGASTP